MPLRLTRHQIAHLATRLQVQPPPPGVTLDPNPTGRVRGWGVPRDVLLTLESLRVLAEQGNTVAEAFYLRECERFGIEPRRHFPMGDESAGR